jgi:protein involved in temperature-dependent protein secretion
MDDATKARLLARFHGAASAEELLELGRELARDHPHDAFALSLGEMVANAIASENPELLDGR